MDESQLQVKGRLVDDAAFQMGLSHIPEDDIERARGLDLASARVDRTLTAKAC